MRIQESPWSDDRVTQLRSCFAAGLSCSQIAREIGVTRNAVIGKLHRIDLQRGHKPAKIKAPRAYKKRIRDKQVPKRLQFDRSVFEPYVPREEDIPFKGVGILELADRVCKYPIGDVGDKDFKFCGNESLQYFPYCAGHCRLAYRRPG